MDGHPIDLSTWPRTDQFRFFRSFERPHFAVTARLDVTGLLLRAKPAGISPYRACLYAIGAGFDRVDALRVRFKGEDVIAFDRVDLSMTVPREDGTFGYAYLTWMPDFPAFDAAAKDQLAQAAAGRTLSPNSTRLDMAYLSCLPWLDYTALTNAMPDADDPIPRIGWGKFSKTAEGFDMAMTVEVHHAIADGRHVAEFFAAVQDTLAAVSR
ncbi:MAG: CatA-like O-acetyltransferase [Pseudomonadota bacterium]